MDVHHALFNQSAYPEITSMYNPQRLACFAQKSRQRLQSFHINKPSVNLFNITRRQCARGLFEHEAVEDILVA
jgi:hypothetical protein